MGQAKGTPVSPGGQTPVHGAYPPSSALPHNGAFPTLRGMTAVGKPLPRLRLQGFTTLTKALRYNIYAVCYAVSEDESERYIQYIDEVYNAYRLAQTRTVAARIIGANVLNVARQDSDPQGAAVTFL